FLCLVAVAHRLVGGGPALVPPSARAVTGLVGRVGFGAGADGVPLGAGGAEPDQPQLLAHVVGGPLRFGRVGVADYPQSAVGHAAHVRPTGGAEREERFVPGGALVGGVMAWFGADRIVGVLVAVCFPVGSDRGRLVLPVVLGRG